MSQQYIGAGRLQTHQSVAYTATAGTVTNTFSLGVTKIRVMCTSDAYIKIGKTPTATTADPIIPANSVEYFLTREGEKVSAVQVSAGGTLHVTELG